MKKFTTMALAAASLFLALVPGAQAQSIQALTSDIPPYAMQNGDRPGFIREIVDEMAKLLNIDVNTSFVTSVERYAGVGGGENVIGYPVMRTAGREAQFTWIVKVFDLEGCALSPAGKPAVGSLEEMKTHKIGANKGSSYAKFLQRNEVSGAVEGNSVQEVAKMLADGTIDAWYTDVISANRIWQLDGNQGNLVKGYCSPKTPMWLAASPNSPAIDVESWVAAFQVLEQDGTFDRIFQAYGLK